MTLRSKSCTQLAQGTELTAAVEAIAAAVCLSCTGLKGTGLKVTGLKVTGLKVTGLKVTGLALA